MNFSYGGLVNMFRAPTFHIFDKIYQLDTPGRQGLSKNRKCELPLSQSWKEIFYGDNENLF